jgi:hypothetical protein
MSCKQFLHVFLGFFSEASAGPRRAVRPGARRPRVLLEVIDQKRCHATASRNSQALGSPRHRGITDRLNVNAVLGEQQIARRFVSLWMRYVCGSPSPAAQPGPCTINGQRYSFQSNEPR